jgi:hypothetical protein
VSELKILLYLRYYEMNSIYLTMAIAMLSLGIAATTATLSNIVYAEAETPNGNDPNDFGEAAKGQGGDLGEHSSDGDAAGTHPYDSDGEGDLDKPGRSGIGNIGNDLGITCDSKHPADLANVLGGNDCEEP